MAATHNQGCKEVTQNLHGIHTMHYIGKFRANLSKNVAFAPKSLKFRVDFVHQITPHVRND